MTLPIQITNIGKVVAQFRFVPKLDEVCPTEYTNKHIRSNRVHFGYLFFR